MIVVLNSGGLDSAGVMKMAYAQGKQGVSLYWDTGQENKELALASAKRLADEYGFPLVELSTDFGKPSSFWYSDNFFGSCPYQASAGVLIASIYAVLHNYSEVWAGVRGAVWGTNTKYFLESAVQTPNPPHLKPSLVFPLWGVEQKDFFDVTNLTMEEAKHTVSCNHNPRCNVCPKCKMRQSEGIDEIAT